MNAVLPTGGQGETYITGQDSSTWADCRAAVQVRPHHFVAYYLCCVIVTHCFCGFKKAQILFKFVIRKFVFKKK